jgi:benzoylformate decarboxylase
MDMVDPPIDFLALAASMGVPARRVERASDIAPALEAAIAAASVSVIEIPVKASSPTNMFK